MEKRKIHISVVSHNQEDLIIRNFKNLKFEYDKYLFSLIIIDNTNSQKLKTFAEENEHKYYADDKVRGYGENHNIGFKISEVKDDEIFIVCNPDVILEEAQLEGMINSFIENNHQFGNVKAYYNLEKTIKENPDRYFPYFLNFVFSILLKKRFHYGTNDNVVNPEWISGGFMIIKGDCYKQLKGFDEQFFMYVEDIDICYRANKLGIKIIHDNNHYIIHETVMDSRNILSTSFKMHIKSVLTYIIRHKVIGILKIAK